MKPSLLAAAFLASLGARAGAAPKTLTQGYVGCSASHDAEPFDLGAPAVGTPIPLGAVTDPTDATISPDGSQLWITDGADSSRFANDAPIWIVDRATNTVIDHVPMGFYNAGVAFTDDGQYAIVTSRDASNATTFIASSRIPIQTAPLPGAGGDIALDPVSKNLYVCEFLGPRLFELSSFGSFVRDAFLGTQLGNVVGSPDCNGLYVTDRGANLLRVVDRVNLTELSSIPVGQDPWGLDVTRDGGQIVVACRGSHDAWVVDTRTWTTTEIPLPGANPRDVDIDDAGRRAYVTGGITGTSDVVFVIDLDTLRAVTPVDVTGSNSSVVAVQPQATWASLGSTVRDDDFDLIMAACDNCPDVYNPMQEDADGDGVGDACEVVTTCIEPSALDLTPGATPLRVRRWSTATLLVNWEDVGAQSSSLYAGTIASLHAGVYDHADTGTCAVGGGSTLLPTPSVNAYYLATGSCGAIESSLGRDSLGNERPPANPRCP